jgi:hypothetical protein
VDGVCGRCDQEEVDPFAGIECVLCRAIAEETGVEHCPMHELDAPMRLENESEPTEMRIDDGSNTEEDNQPGEPGGTGLLQFSEVA